MRWRETIALISSIRWNEWLNCAYKHSGYAFSFSTEWRTLVRVWHVQFFAFVVINILFFSFLNSCVPVIVLNSISCTSENNCALELRVSNKKKKNEKEIFDNNNTEIIRRILWFSFSWKYEMPLVCWFFKTWIQCWLYRDF